MIAQIRSGPLKFQVIKGYPALLQTCKQINKEANDIFLKAVRLNVMPASEDHQVCIRGSPTRNMTRDVRNLKTRMSTWLKTNYDISLLVILFESKKIQRVVFKIGRDVFIWRRRKGGTRIGTTAKVDKPKRDGFNWVAYLGKIVLIWAYQSPYLLFMMYVVTRGGSAWERAKPRIW